MEKFHGSIFARYQRIIARFPLPEMQNLSIKNGATPQSAKDAMPLLTTTSVDVVMAEADIPSQSPLGKKSIPSYEEQLATIESIMTCYNTPITQAAGYVRDLIRTIIALQQGEIPVIDEELIVKNWFQKHVASAQRDVLACPQWLKDHLGDSESKRESGWLPMETAPTDGEPFITRADGWGFGVGIHDGEVGGFISLYGPNEWKRVTGWMRPTSIEGGQQ